MPTVTRVIARRLAGNHLSPIHYAIMFCAPDDLKTESDVEQKLIWPILTSPAPAGLHLRPSDILTKTNTRRLEIGKGTHRRLYFPDYLLTLAGLPLVVIEAKAPNEDIYGALDEARLYATEINALFPSGINPCIRVVACNGHIVATAPADSNTPDLQIPFAAISTANIEYARLLDLCSKTTLQRHADAVRRRYRAPTFRRAVALVGGHTFQNEELPQNTFGATIVGDYGHLFNPKTRADRAFVVRNAYVPSLRRQRYVEPIDRLIRNAVTPATAAIPTLTNSAEPQELTAALRERQTLENQILLLVGSVGAGKSTFIDHLTVVALPEDLRAKSIWLRVNLNEAPLFAQVAYGWMAKAVLAEFRVQYPDLDLDTHAILEKVFSPELNRFRKGPVSVFDPSSLEYRTRVADYLIRLQSDELEMAKAVARYLCSGPGRLLVIVLDNCDKRTRDEQLTMFQIAQWVQSEFRCLVVLPIRDVTFDLHRNEPPLDTALKGLVFRIEPPPFSEVLQGRVRLALEEMRRVSTTAQTLSYHLPNGIRVTYPASDQAKYLASILRSLYAHDRFVRQVMTGLAGRDVRRALEIFLDFCTSGHIGEDEIYKIRLFEGQHVLPLAVVARVLLRMQRRFYDSERSHIKNLVQCHPEDPLPDHFVRLALLHWLHQHLTKKGPAGVLGFQRAGDAIQALVQLGHDADRTREELSYLVQNALVVPEHLRTDAIDDADLVKITASGAVHLQLMANPDYLAACAEETWLSEPDVAAHVARRLTEGGIAGQFARLTTARNAADLVDYLKRRADERLAAPEVYLEQQSAVELRTLREAEAGIAAAEIEVSTKLYVGNVPYEAGEDEVRVLLEGAGVKATTVELVRDGKASRHRGFGFVHVPDGKTALKALDTTGLMLGKRRLVLSEAHAGPDKASVARKRPRPTAGLSSRVFVGNLSFRLDETKMRQLLEGLGFQPRDVVILRDAATHRSKGYGFVEMNSASEAAAVMKALDGFTADGRSLTAGPAMDRATDEADYV
jgi:hypothetical protein